MNPKQEADALGFLGICMRAGAVISGQEACVQAVLTGNAALALLDEQAGDSTRRRLSDACDQVGVPLYGLRAGTLGQAIGKPNRVTAALPPGSMANRLLHTLRDEPRL